MNAANRRKEYPKNTSQSTTNPTAQTESSVVFTDVAANTAVNSTAEFIRSFYNSVLTPRSSSDYRGTTSLAPQDSSFREQPKLRAPILRNRDVTRVASYHALQEWEGYVTSIG